MVATRDPLPPGDSDVHAAGPEEVSVLRHADPVRVRPAGALSGYPLAFYSKRARLTAGGSVIVAAGGRAEVLWPSGSALVLFGEGIGWVGSPSRGEPIFQLQTLDRARLDLMPGDRVELMGGAVLAGDSGPYMLDLIGAELLRVRNQSRGTLRIAFRQEVFDLDPGQSLVLPQLSSGGFPRSAPLGEQRLSGPGFAVQTRGALTVEPDERGVDLAVSRDALGDGEFSGLGVRVHLANGDAARLDGLSGPRATPALDGATPPAQAAPAPGAPSDAANGAPAPAETSPATPGPAVPAPATPVPSEQEPPDQDPPNQDPPNQDPNRSAPAPPKL